MPAIRDAIGTRGERIAIDRLTRFDRNDEPLFHPLFLGDKYPAIDFFVELIGAAGNETPFFFVQVKTTMRGYTSNERLQIRVDRAAMRRLVKYPAPTYIIGVDALHPEGLAFILAATIGGAPQLSSLPTTYPLADVTTLRALYDEVLDFWAAYPAASPIRDSRSHLGGATMAVEKQTWVEAVRSDALAVIVLTRHKALEVIPIARYAPSSGYDLLIRVNGTDAPRKPEFGVATKGTRRPLDHPRRRMAVPNGTAKEVEGSGIPVCLFLFNIVTDDGIYRWLNEPVIEGDDRVSLRLAADPQRDERGRRNGLANGAPFEKIDNDAVRRIVDRVVEWYAAKERIVHRAMTAV